MSGENMVGLPMKIYVGITPVIRTTIAISIG